ncbi:MAG TPA: DNA-formamidopyrimidine glycosylase family protein [Vicinamibacterales bacterium]
MPELPEVEGFARYFAQHALRQPIVRVRVRDERILGVRKEALSRALRGHAFQRVRRHGKHLFADAGEAWLHLHFGMTGDLEYYGGSSSVIRHPSAEGRRQTDHGSAMTDDGSRMTDPRFARVIFDFAKGHLAFIDMRLFGVVDLTPSPEAFIEEHGLGPDPLEMSFAEFRGITARRRGAVKALLMSQDVIAGIGNLYADETLFQTDIHPRRAVDRLSDAEVRAVYNGMRRILREVIRVREKDGDWPRRYLSMHRETGERCPKCGGTIQRTVVMSRTTYFCGKHQK